MAKLYASQGATLFLGARRVDKLAAVQAACERNGSGTVTVIPCDVTQEQDCKDFIQRVVQDSSSGGGIDVLVLNAGVGQVRAHFMVEDRQTDRPDQALLEAPCCIV